MKQVLTYSDDSTRMDVICSLDRELWQTQQNFEQEEYSLEEYSVQGKKLFRNDRRVPEFHAVLGYILIGTDNDETNKLANGQFVWFVSLDTWVGTVVKVIIK